MKTIRISTILILILASVLSVFALGKKIYVAPNGSPTNSGLINSPLDLQTALNFRPTLIGPGDIIFLRGGVYKGIFVSNLVGAPGNPITVRSLPGEWAVIDGNTDITLTDQIGVGFGNVRLSGSVNLPEVVDVWIEEENVQLAKSGANNFTITKRGMDGTRVVPHPAGSRLRAQSTILRILGSDVIFGNLEVTDSKIGRNLQVSGSNAVDPNQHYPGIDIFAPRSKVINTIVHDTGQGIGFWQQAVNSEVYGNILFNNGVASPDRGHGHGIYSQNNTGEKVIENNITFGNFGGYGLHVYGSSVANLRGYSINGNINFLGSWLIGGNASADDIKVNNNFLYGDGIKLGYGSPNNGVCDVKNNYVYASMPIEVQYWRQVTMTGNRFYQNGDPQGASAIITPPADTSVLSKYVINNNSYIFSGDFRTPPFYITGHGTLPYSFESWQKLGFDTNGQWLGASETNQTLVKPKGVDVFYRPNKYEQGRANVVIYNFERASFVNINLSKTGLAPGQKFEIRNGQNFKAAPLFVGVYDGNQSVKINISNLKIAQPWGESTVRNPDSSPEFQVLVVVPVQ